MTFCAIRQGFRGGGGRTGLARVASQSGIVFRDTLPKQALGLVSTRIVRLAIDLVEWTFVSRYRLPAALAVLAILGAAFGDATFYAYVEFPLGSGVATYDANGEAVRPLAGILVATALAAVATVCCVVVARLNPRRRYVAALYPKAFFLFTVTACLAAMSMTRLLGPPQPTVTPSRFSLLRYPFPSNESAWAIIASALAFGALAVWASHQRPSEPTYDRWL